MFSEIIGWIGVVTGIIVSLPQLIQSYREKSTQGVSKRTYQLLFLTMLCYLIRAIAIKEVIFIVSNAVNLVITGMVLYLFEKYPSCNHKTGKNLEENSVNKGVKNDQ